MAIRKVNGLRRHDFQCIVTDHAARRAGLRFQLPYDEVHELVRKGLLGSDKDMIEGAAEVDEYRWPLYYVKLDTKPKHYHRIAYNQHMYINEFAWRGSRIRIVMMVVIEEKKVIVVTCWRCPVIAMPDLYMRKEVRLDSDAEIRITEEVAV